MKKLITLLMLSSIGMFYWSCSNNQTDHSQQVTKAETPAPIKTSTPIPPLEKSEISKHRISSKILGYDLQYWVHLPAGYSSETKYPTLYVTDGLWYKNQGEMPEIADKLMKEKKIESIITIYVDAFDPDNSGKNRRNSQFLCNPNYVKFYQEELIPEIDDQYSTQVSQSTRGMLGLSFGGLNSMYFGIHAHDVFGKIGIQSPAPHPCPDIYSEYSKREKLPIDIYLSTGTVNDKKEATRKLKNILDEKGYNFEYKEVPQGHNWRNWKPLLDDVLIRFYGL